MLRSQPKIWGFSGLHSVPKAFFTASPPGPYPLPRQLLLAQPLDGFFFFLSCVLSLYYYTSDIKMTPTNCTRAHFSQKLWKLRFLEFLGVLRFLLEVRGYL